MKFRGLCLFLQNKFQILQNLGVATNQKVAGSNPSSRTKKKDTTYVICRVFLFGFRGPLARSTLR